MPIRKFVKKLHNTGDIGTENERLRVKAQSLSSNRKELLSHPRAKARGLFAENNEKGIGLVETIAALGVAVIVITALVSLSVFTLRSSNRGKLLLSGSKLANTQLELVRAYRDGQPDWATFVNKIITDGCLTEANMCSMDYAGSTLSISSGESVTNLNQPTEIRVGFFVQDLTDGIVEITDDVLRVTVRVQWEDGSNTRSSYIYTDISNWSF